MNAVCGHCRAPTADGAQLCTRCTYELAKALRSVPGLLEDLMVSLTRQDRLTGGGGHRGAHDAAPLPRLDIPDAVHELGNALTTWARVVAEGHRMRVDVRGPALAAWTAKLPRRVDPARIKLGPLTSLELAACWLAEHVQLIRAHPAARQAHSEITGAITKARSKVDRRAPLAYRGQCWECDAELRAAPRAAIVTCPSCGERHNGPKLRAWLLDQAEDHLVTAAELSAALTALSEKSVAVGTIHSWRSRGQLAPHAWLHQARFVVPRPLHTRDRPLYRVGDARPLVKQLAKS